MTTDATTGVELPPAGRAGIPPVAPALSIVAGLVLIGYALFATAMRDGEGFISGRAMFPFTAGVAALGWAWSVGVLGRAAVWGALLLVGQAAALQVMDAGPRLHYQHYLDWGELGQRGAWPLAVLALQLVAVAAALPRVAASAARWLRDELGAGRTVVLLLILVLTSATVGEDVRRYARELVTASALQLLAIANLVVFVAALPAAALDRWSAWTSRVLGPRTADGAVASAGLDRFAWSCAAFTTIVCALLAVFIYERHPHVQDEVKYLLQARYMAAGMLAMEPPPVPEAFRLYLMDIGPRGWFSVVPPGWAAVLAIGVKLGVPWLVNPVLTGVNVLLAYLLLQRIYDLRTARLATLLLTLSPMHLFLGMSYMAHAITYTFAILAALGVELSRRTGASWPTWLGGILIGFSAIVRQMDGLIFAVCLGLWAIGFGGRRLRIPAVAGLVLGTVLGVSLLLPYNAYFTGHGSVFPIMSYHDRLFWPNANAYGFGPDRGMGWALDPNPGHGPLDATINTNLNATTLNVELFGWAFGSLLPIGFLVLRGRLQRIDRAMLGVVVITVGAYFFNYFSGGPDFAARYWFPALLPLVALAARGVGELGAATPAVRDPVRDPVRARRVDARALATGALLCLGTLAAFVPWRMFDKYHHYLGMRADVLSTPGARGFGRSLVLVRGAEHPDYTSAATYNPLDLHADAPIFAKYGDADVRAALARAYPDRPVWILDGPSITGAGYRVVQGPIEASRLMDSAARQ